MGSPRDVQSEDVVNDGTLILVLSTCFCDLFLTLDLALFTRRPNTKTLIICTRPKVRKTKQEAITGAGERSCIKFEPCTVLTNRKRNSIVKITKPQKLITVKSKLNTLKN